MSRCFYSALFAREGEPLPDILSKGERISGWEYILFTNLDVESKYWTIRKIEMPNESPVVSAKTVKWMPHIFLPEYDIVYWMDACWSFDPTHLEELEEQCKALETQEVPILITKHKWISNVYDEMYAALRGHKISREHATQLQTIFEKESIEKLEFHYETKAILRKTHHIRCVEISEKLVELFRTLSYRDQIALPYLLYKESIRLEYLPEFTTMTGSKNNHVYSDRKDERKVAICFWGLTRSLRFTISSIHRNIFKPLKDAGIEYDIYLHTYLVNHPYSNKRAGETDILLDRQEYKMLNANYVEIEDQDEVDATIPFEEYHSQGDPWPKDGNSFETLNNHIRSLRSLHKVTQMWVPRKYEYTHVMYCRPDVEFPKPIDIEWLSYMDKSIYMPNFAIHTGVNDRFAIGQPREMEIYGSRYLGALDYSKSNLLHAEAYLAHVLEQNSISINLIEFEFMRVRGNGEIENRDSKSRKLTAILYSAKGYSEQLKFFLERGYISDSRYTFIIIAPAQTIQYLRQFPRKNIVLVSREEKGGTFGAWSDILLYNNLYKNYDSFIFLTDECVGPFLPSYNISDWPEFFSKQLGGDVKLVGATINAYCNPKTHAFVDSYCFAMDKDTVSFCIEKGVFSQNYTISALVYTPFFPEQMPEEFVEKTFKMSREIIKAGWNIQSFCKLYEGVDFRFKDMKPEEYNIEFLGQLYGQGNYKGVTLHPYETIFQHILTPIPKLYL